METPPKEQAIIQCDKCKRKFYQNELIKCADFECTKKVLNNEIPKILQHTPPTKLEVGDKG